MAELEYIMILYYQESPRPGNASHGKGRSLTTTLPLLDSITSVVYKRPDKRNRIKKRQHPQQQTNQ
jgi:hypothetical protein